MGHFFLLFLFLSPFLLQLINLSSTTSGNCIAANLRYLAHIKPPKRRKVWGKRTREQSLVDADSSPFFDVRSTPIPARKDFRSFLLSLCLSLFLILRTSLFTSSQDQLFFNYPSIDTSYVSRPRFCLKSAIKLVTPTEILTDFYPHFFFVPYSSCFFFFGFPIAECL